MLFFNEFSFPNHLANVRAVVTVLPAFLHTRQANIKCAEARTESWGQMNFLGQEWWNIQAKQYWPHWKNLNLASDPKKQILAFKVYIGFKCIIWTKNLGSKLLFCIKKINYTFLVAKFEIRHTRPEFWKHSVLRPAENMPPWYQACSSESMGPI